MLPKNGISLLSVRKGEFRTETSRQKIVCMGNGSSISSSSYSIRHSKLLLEL
jgi:hypothetical protein